MFETSKVKIDGNNQTVRTQLQSLDTPEHTKVYSRTLARDVEIGVGIHGTSPDADARGGLCPKNPFVSQAQAGWAHTHPDQFGRKNLKEWDAATKGKHLPKRVKK
jgi:hypothetical protein